MKDLIINPIIPLWLMGIICLALIAVSVRRNVWTCLRRILIIALLFVINMRVMIPGNPVDVKKQEINSYCLFMIDDTLSMMALDGRGEQSRMSVVQSDLEYIIGSLQGAHFSAWSFHNTTNRLSPFTDNGDHVVNSIYGLYPLSDLYGRGTTMNTPKPALISALKEIRKKDGIKVFLFFISDGEHNRDEAIESFSDVKGYIDGGAVLGYGTEAGARMEYKPSYSDEVETVTYWSRETFKEEIAISCLDEKNLKKIASDMGIPYIHMQNEKDCDDVIKDILKHSELVTTNQSVSTIDTAADTYFICVIPLLLLLILEAISMIRKK